MMASAVDGSCHGAGSRVRFQPGDRYLKCDRPEQKVVMLMRRAVEYSDPSDIFSTLYPNLEKYLPLRDLNWTPESRPLRSIPSLHLDFVENASATRQTTSPPPPREGQEGSPTRHVPTVTAPAHAKGDNSIIQNVEQRKERRHQIPGLQPTPYLKLYLLRCSDVESYKFTHRKLLKEWTRDIAQSAQGNASASKQENHNASEWLIIHVVEDSVDRQSLQGTSKSRSESRWSTKGSKGLIEKIRSDFNGSSKATINHVAQLNISDTLTDHARPSAAPLQTSTGKQWEDLTYILKSLILASFDLRVGQYEEDIKERDSQRHLPGWNFNTFFLLKEGLALGFESVGLLDDALNSYHELAAGLNDFIGDQRAIGEDAPTEGHFRKFSNDLLDVLQDVTNPLPITTRQTDETTTSENIKNNDIGARILDISIKPYRDMILANDISLFDFRCYIYARQMSLLFRIANVVVYSPTRDSSSNAVETQNTGNSNVAVSYSRRFSQSRSEDTKILMEICRCTLDFVGSGTSFIRDELLAASMAGRIHDSNDSAAAMPTDVVDHLVMSWAFSVCQSVLDTTLFPDLDTQLKPLSETFEQNASDAKNPGNGPSNVTKTSPKRMFPDRTSSLQQKSPGNLLPNPEKYPSTTSLDTLRLIPPLVAQNKSQGLAASRADLLAFQRQILSDLAFKRAGWRSGRSKVIVSIGSTNNPSTLAKDAALPTSETKRNTNATGIQNHTLSTALLSEDAFHSAYEVGLYT